MQRLPRKGSLLSCFSLSLLQPLIYQEKPVQDVVADYKTAEQREEFANEERKFIDDRVARIIALKREVCDTEDKTFMIVNQKGIDPGSLTALANEGMVNLL